MSASTELEPIVAEALTRWPNLAYKSEGSRAEAAAEYVERGDVRYLGELPISGMDDYEVHGQSCSIAGKDCSCEDRQAPVDARYGKLCKHRLAAMFFARLERERLCAIDGLLSEGKETVLEVRTYYGGSTARQRTMLTRWRAEGGTWQTLADEIPFKIRDLGNLLFKRSLRVKPGARLVVDRHIGGRERWWIQPMEDADRGFKMEIATHIESLYGRDVATAEDQGRERRLRGMVTAGQEAA